MNCISRRDKKDKNLFRQDKSYSNTRWNLYSQIDIENNTLQCVNESYSLTDICVDISEPKPCTLKLTNEFVDIGYNYYE